MTTTRLDDGAAEVVAGGHDSASAEIDGAAATCPTSIDGGIATGYLSAIMGAVTSTCAEIAAVDLGVAGRVRDAADDLGATEAEVGTQFRSMLEDLE